jgi:hypothetical protein
MTTEDKRMIPLSVVDALILKLENQQVEMGATLQRLYKIEMLQEIKKAAIPIPIPIPTQPSIPMSVIDALTASLKCNQGGGKFDPDRIINNNIIKMLEEIKKAAIPSPISDQDQDFEQRIRDRIKHLKENLKTAEGAETFDIDSRIDELEELIPY